MPRLVFIFSAGSDWNFNSSLILPHDTPRALWEVAPAEGSGIKVASASQSSNFVNNFGALEVRFLIQNPPELVAY